MSDDTREFFVSLRSSIEKDVCDPLRRHVRISPNIDYRRVADTQIEQTKEKWERVYEKYDEGEDRQAAFIRSPVDDWLPELSHQLKMRG